MPVLIALASITLAMAGAALPTESALKAVTANPAGNFTAAASFGCTPPTVNPIWMDGMENGVPTGATG